MRWPERPDYARKPTCPARGVRRNEPLKNAMQHWFLDQPKAMIEHILGQAVDRGEIEAAAITEDLWDLLPGYLIFRSLFPVRSTSYRTVQTLVDNVIVPSLTQRVD